MTRLVGCFLLLLCGAGCLTTQLSEAMRGSVGPGGCRHHLTAEVCNTGWFLFDYIPLVCGNPSFPDKASCRFFTNTLNLQNNLQVLDEIIARENGTVIGSVTSHQEGEGFLVFLVTRRSYHTSATLLRPRPTLSSPGERPEKGKK
jgi:hypothetical protein